jgi:hypothetical protein
LSERGVHCRNAIADQDDELFFCLGNRFDPSMDWESTIVFCFVNKIVL